MVSSDVPTVLVVDDEKDMLSLIEHQLDDLPFIIQTTTSPIEALRILQTKRISVLITDYNMPRINGNEVLAAAQDVDANIVSILATGSADLNTTIRAINEGGIFKYIAKPWKKEEIIEAVSDAAKQHLVLCRQQDNLTHLALKLEPRQGKAITEHTSPKHEEDKRYTLDRVLGSGGMGTVYHAYDTLLNMEVAVKVLSPGLINNPIALATIRDEARIAMQLSHRHIVRIHNLQEVNNEYYLVMEYVNGCTFRDIMHKYGKVHLDTALQAIRVSADAIEYAHRHHVLHKDLKPDNLLLDQDGILKVIDFGVSCIMNAQEDSDIIGGTPAYMSPEQIRGEKLDQRTDVYSLGIVFYELITGRNPFPLDATDTEVLEQCPVDVSALPPALQGVTRRAVNMDKTDRWESVTQFAQALMDASIPLIA